MAEQKILAQIDISTLSAGDNDILFFSTASLHLKAIVTIAGLTGALGNIDLLEVFDSSLTNAFEISGAKIAVPANGTEKVETITGCGLSFGGIRIDKASATAGTIDIIAASK